MADEGGIDVACTVKALLKGEDDHHAADALLHPAQAIPFPSPELGAYEIDDRDVQLVERACETEVDIGKVDEDGNVGAALFDGCDQAAVFAIDVGHMADHFGDAHVGHIFGANDAIESRSFHHRA